MASREGMEDSALDGIEELKKSVFSTDTQPETSVCSFSWGHQSPNIQPKPIPCLLPAPQLPSSHPPPHPGPDIPTQCVYTLESSWWHYLTHPPLLGGCWEEEGDCHRHFSGTLYECEDGLGGSIL